jgi:hypothetical protein
MNIIVISLFVSLFLSEHIAISTRIKILFGLRISKKITPLDCFPCFSFWISIIITCFNINTCNYTEPLMVFIIAKFYEICRRN